MEEANGAELIEETALVVRFNGSLQESNFDRWREASLQVIGTFNLKPATAEECGKAKEDAKKCKAAEDAIEAAIADILAQNTEINRIIEGAREIKDGFGNARTAMTNGYTAFAVKQKEAIVNKYIAEAKAKSDASPVAYAFQVNTAEIRACIKGKSSEAAIRKALAAEVERQLAILFKLEATYTENMAMITKVEAEHPSVAPDRKQLALKNPEAVEAMLDARVAQAKAEKAKKKAEEEAAEAKKKLAEAEAAQKATPAPAEQSPEPVAKEAPAFAGLGAPVAKQAPVQTPEQIPSKAPAFLGLDLAGKTAQEKAPAFAGLESPGKAVPEAAPPAGCRIVIDMDYSQDEAKPLAEYLRKFKHVIGVKIVQAGEGSW